MATDNDTHVIATVLSGVDDAVGVPKRKWFIAIVNARHEKLVANKLEGLGFEAYVATQQELKLWKNGKKKLIDRVIIPSIVFIKCSEKERRQIVSFPFIYRFMVNRTAASGTLNKPVAVITDKEIDKLKFMLGQSDYPVNFEPRSFRIKDNVRVIRGSLAGLVGEIAKDSDGKHTLTVLIEQLGYARVNINPQDVELIG